MLLAACETPRLGPSNEPQQSHSDDLEISLRADIAKDRPILVVTITNHSPNAVCIRTEALQNPHSFEMELTLRDSRGRAFRFRDWTGRPPSALRGHVRPEPATSTPGQYYLDSRFQGFDNVPIPRGVSARAAFRYGYCDDDWSLQTRSEWQGI
jgi:hypothetical protein